MDLIAKLEAATEGSVELDEGIATVVYGPPEHAVLPGGQRSRMPLWRYPNGNLMGSLVPPYTTSLDAALTLVPKGFDLEISTHPNVHAEIWVRTSEHRDGEQRGATPALALTIAALKARA